MKNPLLLAALILILVTNGIILLGVAANRRATPEASLVLTERELTHTSSYQQKENSGLSLSLDWNGSTQDQSWFDAQKLNALGFDVEAIRNKNQAANSYQRLLPKKGYVVLEYAGEAWRQYQTDKEAEIAELQEKTPEDAEDAKRLAANIARIREDLQMRSRLFAVDVGPEPDALRQRYADRTQFAIVAARVRVNYWGNAQQEIKGRVEQLLIDRLHVPLALQAPLVALPPREYYSSYASTPEVRDWQPRYSLKVNWGSRLEPWIEAVTLVPDGRND